jgi:hypothetical protein
MKRQLETCVSPYDAEFESGDDDAVGQRADKNRERNREHAKRTRLRKKEMIEGLKMRLLELQREVSGRIWNIPRALSRILIVKATLVNHI